MKFTKGEWINHPWNAAKLVELVRVDFLLSLCHQSPTDETDLHNNEICHVDKVWENIMEEGMFEPLVLRINPTNKEIRLESGNHRVYLAKKNGFSHLPVASFITRQTIFSIGNGEHVYRLPDSFSEKGLVRCPYDYQIKLSSHINNTL
jgi:hypothetical protein